MRNWKLLVLSLVLTIRITTAMPQMAPANQVSTVFMMAVSVITPVMSSTNLYFTCFTKKLVKHI